MRFVKYNPTVRHYGNRNFGNLFGDLFTDFFDSEAAVQSKKIWPRVDIEETNEGFILISELPGIEKEDVTIEIESNILKISGEKRKEDGAKERNIYRKETFDGPFSRSFSLPENVDTESVEAHFKNGLLTLTIPKAEAKKAKKIAIS